MYHFNQKQKIILGILTAIVAGSIYYYVYAKEDDNSTQFLLEDSLEIRSEETEEKEVDREDRILVHVSGAVNQEGIVELEVDSRVSDAIEQARWTNRGCLFRRY